jgi:hypothetical protein
MTLMPMTLAEAEHLCDLYSILKGEVLCGCGEQQNLIDSVAVAPFDRLNKWIFVYFFLETDDIKQSIEFYKYSDFDVVLMSRDHANNEITYKDLRSYLLEQKKSYPQGALAVTV